MKKLIFALGVAALTVVSCQIEPTFLGKHTAYTALIESFNDATKTSMDADRNISWTSNDEVAIFEGSVTADKYKVTDASTGTLEWVSSSGEGEAMDAIVALYPHMENLICTRSDGDAAYTVSNIMLPDVQTYAENSFGNGAFPMVAVNTDLESSTLNFKNVLGAMKLQLKGSDIIKSISVKGNNDEKLSGEATVTAYPDAFPTVIMAGNAAKTATLDCGEGVQLNPETETIFIIALPPVAFTKGFEVCIRTADNAVKTLSTSATTNQVIRSSLLTMPAINLDSIQGTEVAMKHYSFTESDEIIANPERGFYAARSSSYHLSASDIAAKRLQNITIFHIGCYIPVDAPIPAEQLEHIRKEMQLLRDGGAKCVLRFAYSNATHEYYKDEQGNTVQGDKLPWDASPEQILQHIQQLKPILQENSDVIITLQAGFIGVWGEWYYTDHFDYENKDDNYELRKTITDAMLEAMPADRTIALRTPVFKRMMYANSYTDTLTLQTAYNGSDMARISCFNDCFGASRSDSGTFEGEETREYWKKDTRYVFMGGETCGVSDFCTCSASLKDMKDYHWSYLNNDYHQDVIARWETDNCMDEIKRRLGYRLSLTDVYHSSHIAPGEALDIRINIQNTGFAAPMNGRDVELIFEYGNGKKKVYPLDDIDPRYWFAGQTVALNTTVYLPADADGLCTMYLNLPDPRPTLHDNPYFSIRLANDGIWNQSSGYNKIFEFTLAEGVESYDSEANASGENITFTEIIDCWLD